MTEEQAREAIVSRKDARHEIEEKHGADFQEFVEEYGDHDQYFGADVLNWLGY